MQISKDPHKLYGKNQYLLSDSAYARSNWIVPEYKGKTSHSEDNQKFNLCLARSRVWIENSIGFLKGWQSSLNEMRNKMCNVQEVQLFVQWVIACVIFNNLLAQVGDKWSDLYEDNDPPKLQNITQQDDENGHLNMCERVKPYTLDWFNNKGKDDLKALYML
ncbi:hypothetical protein O181_132569 [Austropuccinia psidii MF-1]|uniref:DDE Tnp4 domain-containing protein n=1 Tax=Austropuccinia psidii MF-1 TaxID=1389203 RepID=A0A9Q3L7I4_9BASI|nr:hypothetical protein [Austropuccinia psidii MF-1]